jgi:coenzyme F420-reducing hydrogenase beta subunit
MGSESNISWETLKDVAVTLDSYRIRALIDAKQEILDAGIYSEEQYSKLLFKMFDEEHLKYRLFNYLNQHNSNNFDSIKQFSKKNSLDVRKTLSLLELLKNENLVVVNKISETIEGNNDEINATVFKDFDIQSRFVNPSEVKSIYEPVNAVFESNICSGCGLCAGVCPVNCLDIYNGFGKIDEDKCIKCGMCYFICPRTYLPVDILNMTQENSSEIKSASIIGHYIEAYSARTKIKSIAKVCQDGGITSTCLHYLFDTNQIEKDLNKNPTKLAVVGVPCMMQGLLKSKIYNIDIPALNQIKYRIGIFCMESFSYESFLKICEILKVNIKDVRKTDINKGKFFIYTNSGDELTVPIKEIEHLAREDCEVCFDLTSEAADISIGSIGFYWFYWFALRLEYGSYKNPNRKRFI